MRVFERTHALLARLPSARVVGAEVGVFRGRMSAQLLRVEPLRLIMVDSWLPAERQPREYRDTGDMHAHLSLDSQLGNLARAREQTAFAARRRLILRSDSAAAAACVADGCLDFVFLDADHSYTGVRQDIDAWWPKLRPGGLLGGHDYSYQGRHRFQVRQAVDDAAREQGWTVEAGHGSTWFRMEA